jgi:hypothetical protein
MLDVTGFGTGTRHSIILPTGVMAAFSDDIVLLLPIDHPSMG